MGVPGNALSNVKSKGQLIVEMGRILEMRVDSFMTCEPIEQCRILHTLGLTNHPEEGTTIKRTTLLKILITRQLSELPTQAQNIEERMAQTVNIRSREPIFFEKPAPFLESGKEPSTPLSIWRRKFEDYLMATGYTNLDEAKKASILCVSIVAAAQALLYSIQQPVDTVELIFLVLENFFCLKRTLQFH